MNKEWLYWIGVFNLFASGFAFYHVQLRSKQIIVLFVAINIYLGITMINRWNERSINEALTERIV